MNRLRSVASVLLAVVVLFGGIASAQRGSDRQIRDIVRSLSAKIDDFRYTLDYQLRSSSASRQDSGSVLSDLVTLDRKVSDFQLNLDQHRENKDDVNAIIDAAKPVNAYLTTNHQNQHIDTEWNDVKTLIARLSSNYSVIPRWDTSASSYPSSSGGITVTARSTPVSSTSSSASPLVGTYQIDRGRSESADQIISETNVDQSRAKELAEKLDSPDELAIDIRGTQVTLASSKAPPVSFVADGRDKVETDSSGRSIRTRATLRGEELTVSSVGGDNDYTVTFSSQDGGKTLKVTRRITTEYLNQTVFADSIYTRTDAVAKLGIDNSTQPPAGRPDTGANDGSYSDNDSSNGTNSSSNNSTTSNGRYGSVPSAIPGRVGDYAVPNGIILTGLLDTMIDTKMSQNNDRFKMTVQSPNEFRGAVIEGHLTGVGRSGRVSGSSNVTFNFEKITLRGGQTYDFAGFLQSINDQNGKIVKVDSEGTVRGDSQTNETAKRGGVGAGIGALIGVIAGGGKGAAIGAILGGGAGAGSVIAQGRDDVRLMPGSMITVQSSSPIRQSQQQDN